MQMPKDKKADKIAEIAFDAVSLRCNGRDILSGLTLRLAERRIGLIGANGSGKSSLLRLINGLHAPTQGQVRVDGLDTRNQAAAARRKAGFVFQNPDMQIIMPTVAEDIAFGLHNLRLPQAEIAARTAAIMAEYGLTPFADTLARNLSGGQKQLLALCGVLVMRPEILLLDEPTAQLDLRHKNRMAKLLRSLPQRLIMTTHDLPLLQEFDRVLVLDSGQIAFDGAPAAAIAFYENRMAEQP